MQQPDPLTRELDLLLRECARAFNVQPAAVRAHNRRASAAAARHTFWWVARELWQFSFPELGAMFDFDHTSVMKGIRRVPLHRRIGPIAKRILQKFQATERVEMSALEQVQKVPGEGSVLVDE